MYFINVTALFIVPNIEKKIKLYVIVEIGIFIAVISSIFVFIDDTSQLTNLLLQGKIIHNWFNRSIIGYFTSFMVYIIFPILFIFYLAWKVEIPLVTRYGIILGYAFFIIMLSSVGFVIALEQIIPDKMACVGISCLPVKCTQKLQN